MSDVSDQMELKENLIREKYSAAESLLNGFDHTPRLAKNTINEALSRKDEKSSGIGTRRRFRSTTPGLVTKSTARPEGVRLVNRINRTDGAEDDPFISPVQAGILQNLRRALSTAMVVVDQYADNTGLTALLKDNLQGTLSKTEQAKFNTLLAASSVIGLHVFANMGSHLMSHLQTDNSINIDIGEVEEILTENSHLALTGALWELDQDLALFATDEDKLAPTILAFFEQLMDKVALRASNMNGLEAFTSVNYRVEADDFEINGFTPAARAKSCLLYTSPSPRD